MSQEIMSVEGQLVGMPLAGPESFSQQQLDYLKRALGVDETVLWSGNPTAASDDVTLSESVANFETIRVYANWKFNGTANIPCYIEIPSDIGQFSLNGFSPTNTATQETSQMQVYLVTGTYTISTTTIKPINIIRFRLTGASGNSASVGNISFTDTLKIYKVVGIHRIAGGN
jgi:hypothetical protein